ncbi:hypothetical protein Rhe02_40450 [Rhizocola hellebori]|uniref:Uncharacterized protein n=1 Tax=Rhizocola hellebori TaxID=1392758 RepID=A0A8J3QA54_9ACTN|nr:hypothetical protein [Rhizocola hellebori]GIH05978.1 hypothetical protein Rhe02_40450 [Rhizocola hellebori]
MAAMLKRALAALVSYTARLGRLEWSAWIVSWLVLTALFAGVLAVMVMAGGIDWMRACLDVAGVALALLLLRIVYRAAWRAEQKRKSSTPQDQL